MTYLAGNGHRLHLAHYTKQHNCRVLIDLLSVLVLLWHISVKLVFSMAWINKDVSAYLDVDTGTHYYAMADVF